MSPLAIASGDASPYALSVEGGIAVSGEFQSCDGRQRDGVARTRGQLQRRAIQLTLATGLAGLLLGINPLATADPIPTAPPQDLSAAGQDAANPHVAVDGKGNALVVWERFDGTNWRIQARRRSAIGSFSPVQTVSNAGQDAGESQVAVDSQGGSILVWKRFDVVNYQIKARRRSSSGTLSSVQTLSDPNQIAETPQVAVDPQGDAIVVWRLFDGTNWRIQARRRASSGTLGPVQTLSKVGEDAERPQVAVDPNGNAVVVWERSDGTNERIQARRRSTSGTLGPVQTLSGSGESAFSPDVAMDMKGNALVGWQRSDGTDYRVQIRRRSAAGTLGPVQTLSDAGEGAEPPQLAVVAGGNAVVVWGRSDGLSNRIQVRGRSASGTLSAVRTLSDAGQTAEAPQVAVDIGGNAVAVWARSDGVNSRIQSAFLLGVQTLSVAGQNGAPDLAVDGMGNAIVVWIRFQLGGSHPVIQARRRSASGTLSSVQTLSKADAYDPRVALDPDGNAIVVWQRSDGTNNRVQSRRRSASGTLSAVQTLSKAGQDALDPEIVLDHHGNAIVVWRRFDGANWRIQARRRSASGTLGPVQTLSKAGQDALGPQVVMDANGNAIVGWTRFDGAHYRIQLRPRSSSGMLGSTQTLSEAGQDAFGPQLGVDGVGNAVVVWGRSDGTNGRIQLRRRSASGTISPVQTLSGAGQSAGDAHVAVDGQGNALVVWSRSNGTNNQVQARRRSVSAGALSSVQTLSDADLDTYDPRVVVMANGNAVVVWRVWNAGFDGRIQARRRSSSGTLSPVQTLSDPVFLPYGPALALDRTGNAVVAWSLSGHSRSVVQAARFKAA
jgi:hypothetical protein